MTDVQKGIYVHFKGGRYEVLDIATHSESGEKMVVYRALYGEGGLWVRPLSMWNETVERDGMRYRRFVPEGESNLLEEAAPAADKLAALKEIFGYPAFRPGQEAVIDRILSGQDVLGVMPTGAGKSICYQLPAMMRPGTAIVVSPLISLMKDQVSFLTEQGVKAAYINSSLSERQMDLAMSRAEDGQYKLIYVAPERLMTERFLRAIRRMHISLVAIDEAHCISQWGQDFRPGYLTIPDFIAALPVRPAVCALTATATAQVKEDIKRLLRLQNPYEVATGFDRPNLFFAVQHPKDRSAQLLSEVRARAGQSGIIYCSTRKTVEQVHTLLNKNGIEATRYHAGLADEERQVNQEDFTYDRVPIIVATNAFGMGIDKSDVRYVIHYNMPKDPESYYQEAGRAGRDGGRADCILFFSPQDVVTQRFFIDHMGEDGNLTDAQLRAVQEKARVRLDKMARYARTTACLRRELLAYFGETMDADCEFCGNCAARESAVDVTDAARQLVSCVQATRQRYGASEIVHIARGTKGAHADRIRPAEIPAYASLKEFSRESVAMLMEHLIAAGYLRRTDDGFSVVQLAEKAAALLRGEVRVQSRPLEPAGAKRTKTRTPRKSRSGRESISDAANLPLYEALRQLRGQIAAERHLPPYMIFPDASIEEICAKKPRTKDHLLEISGIGQFKVKAYGERILAVITAYR